ncbi:MAG: hypothetical protein JWM11_6226, partial [Planctomycetaceae bacterium]|nr:hypothetical protein [Planctomycetaceae bacterium]
MQRIRVSLSLLMAVGAALVGWADDNPKPTGVPRSQIRAVSSKLAANGKGPSVPPPPGTRIPDNDAAIRKVSDSIAQAYLHHNAKAFAAVFTVDGEYLDLKEALFHGRDAIEKEFTGFFQTNPESIVSVTFDVIRPIAPGIVKIQGTTRFQRTPADHATAGQCSLVCAKEGDRWLIASLREIASPGKPLLRHEQVGLLKWMLGDWLHEGPNSEFHFFCRWDQSGNYLLRDFSVRAAGRELITGTQRIGYDPISGHLKIWTFDSEGGYSHGSFQQQGESWILHSTGVTAEGQVASGTEVFTLADPHRIVWDTVDRNIGGRRIADTTKITIVRKPPAP